MKRLFVILGIFIIVFTGCDSEKGYKNYEEAMSKYTSLVQGQEKLRIKMDLDFNTAGLSFDEIQELSFFEEFTMEMDLQYDHEKAKAKTYVLYGGIGNEAYFYQLNDSEVYLQFPIINKFFRINEVVKDNPTNGMVSNVNEEVLKPVIERWINILNEEDVVVGRNTMLSTSAGNVKASVYTIHLKEEQLRSLFEEVLKLISMETIEDWLEYASLTQEELLEAMSEVNRFINKMELKRFDGEVYIDYDGYPILQTYDVEIGFSDTKGKELEKIKVSLEFTIDHYNQAQVIEFPEIMETEVLDINDFDEDIFNQILKN